MSATESGHGQSREPLIYADTSFLISLLVGDGHFAAAEAAFTTTTSPLVVSALGRLEFRTAVWNQVGRGTLDLSETGRILRSFESRFERGVFLDFALDPAEVWDAASGVSDRQAATFLLRSLDVLHLSYALVCGAKRVFSFDDRLRKATVAEGLSVNP